MAWTRLEDDLDDNQKIQAVSNDALAVWVLSLTFANRKRTDGFLTLSDVRRLLGMRQAPESVIAELLAVLPGYAFGLWERNENGYQIHDYLKYNRSRARLEKEAEEARERMSALRHPSDTAPPGSRERSTELQSEPYSEVRTTPVSRYPVPGSPVPGSPGPVRPHERPAAVRQNGGTRAVDRSAIANTRDYAKLLAEKSERERLNGDPKSTAP